MKFRVITGCYWQGDAETGGYYTRGNPRGTTAKAASFENLDDIPEPARTAVCALLVLDRGDDGCNRLKGVGESERRSEDRYYFWIDQDYKLED